MSSANLETQDSRLATGDGATTWCSYNSPLRRASWTASARELAPSFRYSTRLWVLTVLSDRCSTAPISRCDSVPAGRQRQRQRQRPQPGNELFRHARLVRPAQNAPGPLRAFADLSPLHVRQREVTHGVGLPEQVAGAPRQRDRLGQRS